MEREKKKGRHMTKSYFNIPVDDEETYIAVKAIAESNGFGKRGMGQQIKAWVNQTLTTPVCGHPKMPVQVQRSPSDTVLTGVVENEKSLFYQAYYCPTCNRVYQHAVNSIKISRPVAEETPTGNAQDPYGQPTPIVVTKRKKAVRQGEVRA
jgi:ssDNA-binding Zn-finger/Zn-ribbon topoisomerase 1